MSSQPQRLPALDVVKAVCSQLIVLHHLAFYGPMSDVARPLAPALIDWLADYARIAVQVFLVVGGFLAARSLAPDGWLRPARPWQTLLRRYRKLAVPFAFAILLSIGAAALARQWMVHESIPGVPHLGQLLAHLLLLHDVIGVESLSAGAWYVAIDLQLFALLLAILWMARRLPDASRVPVAMALVIALASVSLWWFNRDPDWDRWGLYFFGAYGLGVLAWWLPGKGRGLAWTALLAAVTVSALWFDFRSRIAVAALTALWLGLAHGNGSLQWHWGGKVAARLGQISYSVFLVHFPVCLVTNALVSRLAPEAPLWNAAGMLSAWALSNAAGAVFHRYIELGDPLSLPRRWLPRPGRTRTG